MTTTYEGILPVFKPAGYTSHDVVAKTRGILGMKRIGHTGTLDPAVTGVLPLCLGRATRMVEYLQELPKQYEATLVLGIATDTEDMSGTVTEKVNEVNVTHKQIEDVIQSFIGTISQIPPMYSALKQDGKRLYELARQGKVVERKPREVIIHELELISANLDQEQPTITISVLCSKGTYIRTLCVDIGQALGVPAVMSNLKRTMSSGISLHKCLTFEDIVRYTKDGTLQSKLMTVDEAVDYLPSFTISEMTMQRALQGQTISPQYLMPAIEQEVELLRLYGPNQQFLGIFRLDNERGIRPVKVFHP